MVITIIEEATTGIVDDVDEVDDVDDVDDVEGLIGVVHFFPYHS